MIQVIKRDFSPKDLNGLFLWYSADYAMVNLDGEKDQNGQSVSYLYNLVGNDVHAYGISEPIFYENIVNSRPAIYFDGISNYMTFDTINSMSSFSIFVVQQTSSYSPLIGSINNSSSVAISSPEQLNALVLENSTGIPYYSSALTVPGESFSLTEYVVSGGSAYFFHNGEPKSFAALAGSFTFVNSIGSSAALSNFATGYIAEIVLYIHKRYLDTERQNIERYFNRKYNLWYQN